MVPCSSFIGVGYRFHIPLQRCKKLHPTLPCFVFGLNKDVHPFLLSYYLGPGPRSRSLPFLSLTLSSLCVSGKDFTFRLTDEGTKYVEYVPSPELGLSHPFSRQRVCPSPRNQRGAGHTCLRVRGWWSPNSDDWRKCLELCLLCGRGGRCTQIRRQPKKLLSSYYLLPLLYLKIICLSLLQVFHYYTLQRQFRLYIPFLGIARPQPQFLHSCVCEQFIYSQDRSTYFLQQKRQLHLGTIIRSQTHECGNWD
jgi:hypothetical protein